MHRRSCSCRHQPYTFACLPTNRETFEVAWKEIMEIDVGGVIARIRTVNRQFTDDDSDCDGDDSEHSADQAAGGLVFVPPLQSDEDEQDEVLVEQIVQIIPPPVLEQAELIDLHPCALMPTLEEGNGKLSERLQELADTATRRFLDSLPAIVDQSVAEQW